MEEMGQSGPGPSARCSSSQLYWGGFYHEAMQDVSLQKLAVGRGQSWPLPSARGTSAPATATGRALAKEM